ncbi:beta strand repeat-containing protein [Gemmatimonas sp.]|uniref:beta strand repeat-containing protein n=1 Tax=Gemmatimonas sp. TaxID=1962908 RepID=UPI003982DE9D
MGITMHRWRSLVRTTLFSLSMAACSGGGDGGTTQPPVAQSIGLQLSATSGTVARGGSGNSTISLSRLGGYAGSVALTAENLPAGVTATFTPTPLVGSATSATVVFVVGSTATAGSSTITVRAVGSSVSAVTATYALTIPAPAVALTAGSGASAIVIGGSATVPITITRSNGFTDVVTLAAAGLPTGVTATFTPATIAAGSTTSTLTLTVASNATSGTSTVTISATGSGVTTQTASLALTLTAAATPAISVTSTPAAVSIVAGATGTTAIGVSRTGGFAGDVTLALEGAPAGVSGAFSANPVLAAGTSSTLTISTTAAAVSGIYNLTVRGTGTGVTAATTTVAVTVAAAPAITVAAAPAAVTVAAGSAVTTAVTITREGGYTADIALAATGLPVGVTASFAPATLTGGTLTSTLTLTSTTSAAVGAAAVIVTASGPGVTAQTASVNLTVTAAPTYTMTATAVTAQQGTNGTSMVTLARGAGFVGTVNLTVTGLPAGVTAAFNPASVTGTTSTLTLTVAGAVVAGNYTGLITGTTAGVANVTANVALTVTATGGGTGNVNWQFCDASLLPLWFAYRDGTTGAWTRVAAGANQTYAFTINSTVGGVAYAQPLSGGPAQVTVNYFTRTELTQMGTLECVNNRATKSLTGSFAGLGSGQTGTVNVGSSLASAAFPTTTFSVNADDGSTDLLAFRTTQTFGGTSVAIVADRAVLRRDVNYAANSAIPVIDFSGAESFPVQTAQFTVNGGGSDLVQVYANFQSVNGSFSGFAFGALFGGASPYTVYGIPLARTRPGDLHMAIALASTVSGSDVTQTRLAAQYNRELANRTLTIGPSLTSPTISVAATTPYARLKSRGNWQAEYADGVGAGFTQSAGSPRSWTMSASRGYFGASAEYELELPDFSGVAGFDNSWGLRTGVATTWTTNALGGLSGFDAIVEGAAFRTAARIGTITP